jgi:hypothetical protein
MTKHVRTRSTRIDIGLVEAVPGWANSTVTFTDWRNDTTVKVTVEIKDPWTLKYLQDELDKISAYWKEKAAL